MLQPAGKSPLQQFRASQGQNLKSDAIINITEFSFQDIIANVSYLHNFNTTDLAFPNHSSIKPIPFEALLLKMYTDFVVFTFCNATLESVEAILLDAGNFSPLGSLVLNGLTLEVKYQIGSTYTTLNASAAGFMWVNNNWFEIIVHYNNPSKLMSITTAPISMLPGLGPYSALLDDPK